MDKRDKALLSRIFFLGIIDGVLNVVGIASILPFISVISEPGLIETNKYIKMFSDFTGIDSRPGIIFSFGLLSFSMILMGNIIGVLDTWVAIKFTYVKEKQLSRRLFSNYLKMDSLSFRAKNNSEQLKNILTEIERVILGSLFAMIDMMTSVVLAVFVFILLALIDFYAAVLITSLLSFIYFIIYWYASKHLSELGEEFAEIETDLYKNVMTGLSNHGEIKLARAKKFFLDKYSTSFTRMMRNRLKFEFISLIPQQLIEVVAFGTIIFLAIYFTVSTTSNFSAITMISIYAFAAYRLMPAISEIFDSFEQIQYGSAVLKRITKEFEEGSRSDYNSHFENNETQAEVKFSLNNNISLTNISFTYGKEGADVLDNFSFSFAAKGFHCVVGDNGSGKSTLLNIIAGLYRQQSGEIHVDGKVVELFENSNWFNCITYVPPKVNLINGSILENIALGFSINQIDREHAIECSRLTGLDNDVKSFHKGYESLIDDRDVGFSSGQLKKLGITRALYEKPKLLLLDESTDALDHDSELMILNNIKDLDELTVILVSHRSSAQTLSDSVVKLGSSNSEN